ncbi:MAG TPA: hypothetical protein VHV78_17545, partial [Gemmatimonadaceae bacterium]|nr:hypothetical protein [Gemmatimonadaceae bacterium]
TTGAGGATPAQLFTTSTISGLTQTITATDAAASSIVGNANVTTTVGAAAKLAIITQPSASAQSGVAFATQPVVQLEDANGNDITQIGVSVTASVSTGAGTLGGTLSTSTDALGRATFTNLKLDGVAGNRTLSFGGAGLVPATSGTITLSAGTAAKLSFSSNPTTTASGNTITPAVTVNVLDVDGNVVTTATNQVAVAITAGSGTSGATLAGTASVAAAGGVATFSTLSIALSGSAYTLTATSAGLTSSSSTAFNVTAPPPSLNTIDPATADAVFATVPITLTGAGFVADVTSVAVSGSDVTASSVAVLNDTLLTAILDIPSSGLGLQTVRASNSGTTSNGLGFTVYAVGSAPLQTGSSEGGSGGSAYSLDCADGSVATGLNARGGSNVDQIQVICQTVSGASRSFGSQTFTGTAGGDGGNAATLSCPANYVLTGLTGRVGDGGGPDGVNDMIAGICSPIAGGSTVTTASVGSVLEGSVSYSSSCPAGMVMVGIQGAGGDLLDRTQIKCK